MVGESLESEYEKHLAETRQALIARQKCVMSICRKAKVSRKTVQKLMYGELPAPKVQTLLALSRAAETFPTDLEIYEGLKR